MSGYKLHSEAYADIDEIREYIAADNPDAADRVVTELFDSIRAGGGVSKSRLSTTQSDVPPAPVHADA